VAVAVVAEGLVKRFGRTEALRGVDLEVERAQVLGVLGPNGAGKTTFIRTISTLLRPDEGTLRVAGMDVCRQPAEVRRLIGLAGQYAAVEETMTGRENLQMVGRLFGHGRRAAAGAADQVLAALDLSDAGDRLVRTYSGGMRRRLDLGASLVGAPRLLLLDEPTTGLDPRSRIQLWDTIEGLVANGTDVLLTTQYLEEADRLADQVVIIDRGRVIAQGTPDELKRQAGRDVIEVHLPDLGDLERVAKLLAPVGCGDDPRVDASTRQVTVTVDRGPSALTDAVRALDELTIVVDDIGLRRPTLDEVFLTLTGNPTDDTQETQEVPAS
jgi:ABC-2 type transport system ATP-binding protein